jgi:uncharacterized membrane protein
MAESHDHSAHIKSVELERLIFFSDAVFAIAITLLVLELRVPERAGPDVGVVLRHGLLQLIPRMISFVFSFALIGIYWFVHHRIFRHIRRWDEGLIFRNLVLLFWIAFLPFPVALNGAYGDQPIAVTIYAAGLMMTGLSQLWVWRYASHNGRLLDPGYDPRLVRLITVRSCVAPLVALLVIVLAWVLPLPWMANFAFGAIFPLQRLAVKRYERGAGTPRSD